MVWCPTWSKNLGRTLLGLSSASSFEVEKWSQFPCQTTFSVWIFPLNCKVACSIICGRIICGNAWSSRAPTRVLQGRISGSWNCLWGPKIPSEQRRNKKTFSSSLFQSRIDFDAWTPKIRLNFYRIAFDALFSHGHVHEIASLLNYLGDIHLLRQQRTGLVGLENGQFCWRSVLYLKLIYSENATKFFEIFPLLLTTVHTNKSKGKISQNFVAFSGYKNFIMT